MSHFRRTQSLCRVMFYLDTRGTEITNGLMALMLGLFYTLTGWVQNHPINMAYETMRSIAPGSAWGMALGVFGGLQLLCLRRKTHPHYYHWRRFVTAGLLFIYLLIAVCFLYGAPQSAGAIVFSLPALYQAWIYARIGDDGRTYHHV